MQPVRRATDRKSVDHTTETTADDHYIRFHWQWIIFPHIDQRITTSRALPYRQHTQWDWEMLWIGGFGCHLACGFVVVRWREVRRVARRICREMGSTQSRADILVSTGTVFCNLDQISIRGAPTMSHTYLFLLFHRYRWQRYRVYLERKLSVRCSGVSQANDGNLVGQRASRR